MEYPFPQGRPKACVSNIFHSCSDFLKLSTLPDGAARQFLHIVEVNIFPEHVRLHKRYHYFPCSLRSGFTVADSALTLCYSLVNCTLEVPNACQLKRDYADHKHLTSECVYRRVSQSYFLFFFFSERIHDPMKVAICRI
jgi:hypothetical protein